MEEFFQRLVLGWEYILDDGHQQLWLANNEVNNGASPQILETYLRIAIDCRNHDLPQGVELDFIGAFLESRPQFLRGRRLRGVFKHDSIAGGIRVGHGR